MNNKMMEEEDLKGLEEEIDNAVDRLFVEKKGGVTESFLMESLLSEPSIKPPTLEPSTTSPPLEPSLKSPVLEPSMETPILENSIKTSLLEPSSEGEKGFDLETPLPPPSVPAPFLKSIEKMEAQLLSLEWEITDEKLKKTREEVLALEKLLKQRTDIVSILTWMEKVLSHMIDNEENIRPLGVKFLLDSKETIKLLMKKETEGEINIYKQLAYWGIEARFSCLEGMKKSKIIQPLLVKEEVTEKAEFSIAAENKIETMSNKMNLFMGKVEEIFSTMKEQLSRLEETTQKPTGPSMETRSKPMNVTIFKVNEKLFGVETEKVFKLFKVPMTFYDKFSEQSKIRLRDLEVRMINLKKIFSISEGDHTAELRILTVKDNGEYKGIMVDQVLKKLFTYSDEDREVSDYFSGVIHSTYQEQSVEIPILNLKKF